MIHDIKERLTVKERLSPGLFAIHNANMIHDIKERVTVNRPVGSFYLLILKEVFTYSFIGEHQIYGAILQ